jgi:hydrophobe/amphiphile efflux-1 (HAE1) family protein
MSIAEVSIRRPVLTTVVSLLILLWGALAALRLGVREYPAIDPPTISISTSYPGAAAEVVQAQVTEPIEDAVNTVSGITNLTSTSREGVSQVTVEFSLDTDLETAASDVRDQLSRAARSLPVDVDPPVLTKASADSSSIFGVSLSSDTRNALELSAYADSLAERLQTTPGVAYVELPGERRYAMRLWMDPDKLQAYNLSTLDVRQALTRENIELPSGRIEGSTMELPVKTLSRLSTVEQFNALVVKRTGDRIVRFADIGYAELGAQNDRNAAKMGNVPIVSLYFRQQPGANQIEIIDELKARIERMRAEIPPDIRLEASFDNSEYVRRSLSEVTETIFIAFALVVLVVFAFLREWRTTLIPVLAIPVSIIGSFGVMAAAGFSINVLTLLGIVLAIGLVVDDAIVVLENIYSRIEGGEDPVTAGIRGTNEIQVAVMSTTLTLAVVFLPLLFIGGLSGRLFREFGVTIAGAVLISALVALTLTPMLCARLLKTRGAAAGGGADAGHADGHGWLFRRTEPFFRALESGYSRSLAAFLRLRWIAPAILVLAGGLIYALLQALPRELSPLEDRGRFYVRAQAPEGVTYEWMQQYMDGLSQAVIQRVPEMKMLITMVPGNSSGANAVNNGTIRVFLKERDERTRGQQEIVDSLRGLQRDFPGARVNITQDASIGERRQTATGTQMVVQGPTLAALQEKLPAFLEKVSASPVFTYVDSDLKFTKPEVQVQIDRDKAQMLGLSALDISQTLQSALSGQRYGYFLYDGKQYDVIGQLTRDYRARPDDLGNIAVRSAVSGESIPLSNVVSLTEGSAPPELYRVNRYTAATLSGTLAKGRTMDEGIAAFREAAAETLDERFTTQLTGAARDFAESSSSLGWVFLLALVLIYLVLAAQFESFRDPLVILFTVPLALVGALGAVWVFGQTLNIFSQIGLIMLIGLVTKNGILIVEFAGQRRDAGIGDASLAVQQAAAARLRPILMTTLAMILGILPIALALGAGAESRVAMGIAVIGGLVVGSALTLYVIPAMYVLLQRRAGRASRTIASAASAPAQVPPRAPVPAAGPAIVPTAPLPDAG